MSRRRRLLSCAPALSAVLLASSGGTPADPARTNARENAIERGLPALFSWADFDGDGRLDLAAVKEDGTLQLLVNAGNGRFENATERVGLAEIANAALALWADYDGDGRLDLFVGAREGASRLFHNERGAFVDMTAGSGLVSEGAVQSAQWFDHDGDGRLDLFVVTPGKSQLFRGLEGGFFELAELPLVGAPGAPGLGASPLSTVGVDTTGRETPSAPGSTSEKDGSTGGSMGRSASVDGVNASGGRIPLSPTLSVGGVTPLVAFPTNCANSVRDQANPSSCLQATSVPTPGLLFPGPHLGGVNNVQSGTNSFVGGGQNNQATNGSGSGHTTVGGGLTNSASGDRATVGGGYRNTSSGSHAAIAGGRRNTASGSYATVSGGYNNTASGSDSTVGGGTLNTSDSTATVAGGSTTLRA